MSTSKRVKWYNVYGKATDSNGEVHYVTVVGKFEQKGKPTEFTEEIDVETKPNTLVKGEVRWVQNVLNRKLTLGVSICHPTDTFDIDKGVKVAKDRIERGESVGSLETSNATMLTEDAIMAELIVKLTYITEHIDGYIV